MTDTTVQAPASQNGTGGGNPAPHVTLGDHSYPVYAQRIGYLENKLGSTFTALATGDADASTLGSAIYGVLKVFIPKLMPEYEFRGYANEGAFERGEYDEEHDQSPDPAQIVWAFETAMRINRLDLFKHLGKLLGPDMVQQAMMVALAGTASGTSQNEKSGEPSQSE